MFDQVAHFIFIHVTALKHIKIFPWSNKKNKVPTIHNFHIHFNDFKNNIFDKVIPSYIFYKEHVVK